MGSPYRPKAARFGPPKPHRLRRRGIRVAVFVRPAPERLALPPAALGVPLGILRGQVEAQAEAAARLAAEVLG